ncbi:hypothetical protein [Turicimonas muris]|uniref:hypothetical protein n=1 Tax=Turicimonas muris TaxID=1796652 RepID=UPI0026E1015F|nr:hypothetical protein [Turicimonas muris]
MKILIIVLASIFVLVALMFTTALLNKLDSLGYQVLQLQARVRRMEKKEENR